MRSILVIGDVIVDQYTYGRVRRLNPESPSPLLSVEKTDIRLGWAANVAANIAALCDCKVTLLWRVWQHDTASKEARRMLQERGIELVTFADPEITVPLKDRYIELTYNQQLLRTDRELVVPVSSLEWEKMIEYIKTHSSDLIIVSDYLKGTLFKELSEVIAHLGSPVIVDTKLKDPSIFTGVTCIKPNLKEFGNIMGVEVANTDTDIEKYAPIFCARYNTHLLVTRSEKWASLALKDGSIFHTPAAALSVFDVTGAGDTFLAAFAIKFLESDDYAGMLDYANRASSSAVSSLGTTIVRPEDIA
jgi:D-glycero-beta-D-manno-heptose-7-phosphate kinase